MILDVLHYIDSPRRTGAGAGARRPRPGGLLLLRVGDADAGVGFALSSAVDHTVAAGAPRPLAAPAVPPLPAWQELLARLGFRAARCR